MFEFILLFFLISDGAKWLCQKMWFTVFRAFLYITLILYSINFMFNTLFQFYIWNCIFYIYNFIYKFFSEIKKNLTTQGGPDFFLWPPGGVKKNFRLRRASYFKTCRPPQRIFFTNWTLEIWAHRGSNTNTHTAYK